jgi:hypothetical protein
MTSPNGTRLRPDDVVGARLIEWATHIIERNDPTLRVVRDSSGLLNHGDELRMTSIAGVPVDLPRDHPVWTRRSSPEEIVVVASVTHGVECYDAWREDGPCQHEAEVEPT